MAITLTYRQDIWIAAQITDGRHVNDSETIRQALIQGEQSGEPEPFDFEAFKRRKTAQSD